MRLARRLIASVFVLLVLIISSVWAGVHVGRWLVVEDALAPADVIVVLSGDLPGRAAEAARLYREHYAPRIWISRSVSPAAELKRMHIDYIGEEFYNQKVLIVQGVPADAIHVLEEPAFNTLEEVDQIARECRREAVHTVIVVTAMPHTRRVWYIWQKRIGDDPRLIIRHVPPQTFDSAHWWRKSSDALAVVREVLGLANAGAGFPAKPDAHR